MQITDVQLTVTGDEAADAAQNNRWFRIWKNHRLLALGPLGFAVMQSFCIASVILSGFRTAIGFSALMAATAEPATGLHAKEFRVPMLAVAVLGAAVNLALHWNSERLRRNPSARWRLRPPTRKERIGKWIQLGTSILTLVLVLVELLAHPHFHHEM